MPDIHLSLAAYLVALTVVTCGATVQGTLGFGANLLAVPVVALLEPAAVPATTAIIVFPLAAGMTVAERHHVDWRGVGWLLLGRLPGTVIGVAVVALVAPATLSVLTGLAVLVAVAVSVARATVPVTRPTTVAAGVASGAMGTATSIGGPPLALLYQHHEGPVLRSTLAVTFGVGT
ncbi:MAG TPA: sulfite exporter TauE/SafE family protein, partial [Acidimicrobiales bacterium]|nr:sulfite exporter TauE/SafE family protein [Acidimicrobiales bacterium]